MVRSCVSFYERTLDPQIRSVILNSCHRSKPSLIPVTGMSDRIFCELFLLCSPIVQELCFGALSFYHPVEQSLKLRGNGCDCRH